MKKIILSFVVSGILMMSSCSKNSNNSATNLGGNWTFKSTTHTTLQCNMASLGTLSATDGSASNASTYGEVDVQFYNLTPPTMGGTFKVGNKSTNLINPAYSNYVILYAYTNGGTVQYASTGNDNKTVNVTITNGKVTVTGSNIEMVNNTNPSDSSAITLNITQL